MVDPTQKKRSGSFSENSPEKKRLKVEDKKTQTVSQDTLKSLAATPINTSNIIEKNVISTSKDALLISVTSMIDQCKFERQKKLSQLDPNTQKIIEHFADDLSTLLPFAKQYAEITDSINKIEQELIEIDAYIGDLEDLLESEKNEEHISKHKKEIQDLNKKKEPLDEQEKDLSSKSKSATTLMKKKISSFLESYKVLSLESDMFSPLYKLDQIEEKYRDTTLVAYQEQILNKCVNSQFYISEVSRIIEKNKQKIIEIFYQGDSKSINGSHVSFKIHPSNLETHNLGKMACKIIFIYKENSFLTIYYKPRNAEVDLAVIELFFNLNKIEHKSLNVSLPVYKIGRLEGVEDCSLWEFIDGKSEKIDVQTYIDRNITSENHQKYLREKLKRLESIATAIQLSDLHGDNVIFKGLDSSNPEIVPIDLESFQEGNSTGLCSSNISYPKLNAEEMKLISEFNLNRKKIPFRLVPIPTGEFLGALTNPFKFQKLTEAMISAIKNQGYILTIKEDELASIVLKELIYDDVPYLTELSSVIYLGSPHEKQPIAKKKD